MTRRPAVALALALALALLVPACASQQEKYCEAAAEARDELVELSDEASQTDSDAVLRAIPILERLDAAAPDELTDEYQTLLNALHRFQDTLDEADIKLGPGAQERIEALPPDQRTAVEAAAGRLASEPVVDASVGIEGYTKDVCGVRLSL